MSDRLYVRPHVSNSGMGDEWRYEWLLVDASGEILAEGGDSSQEDIEQTLARNDLPQVRLIGLLPARDVTSCLAHIPGKQARFVHQALPFAVEEQLAQDIDSVHLALGPRKGKEWQVAAVDRQRMAAYFETFSGWNGTQLEALYPDAALLPVKGGDWTLCLEGEEVLVASAEGAWYSIPIAGLAVFMESLVSQQLPDEGALDAEPRTISVYGRSDDLETHHLELAALDQLEQVQAHRETLQTSPMTLLSLAFHRDAAHPFNLCQGAFSVRSDKAGNWRLWRPAAAVAALWFVLQVGLDLGQGFYYQRQAEDLESRSVSIYRSIFPGDTQASAMNIRSRLKAQLRAADQNGPGNDFLTLLGHAGYQYSTMPNRDDIRFNTINYSRARGELVLELRADEYGRFEALKDGVASVGLQARIGSVVNDENGTRGRLTISGG
ncbi:type II secretion system protein GspL [Marinobacteraceae bacterium S3BR75-40.1]